MPDLTRHQGLVEHAYNEALTCIAMGVERSEFIIEVSEYGLTHEEMDEICGAAKRDALKQGVEREDIDDSWFD